MAANKVGYASAGLATERTRMGRSFALWARGGNAFPWESVREDNNLGELLYENFLTWAQQTISASPFVGTYVGGNGTPWKTSEGTTTQGSIIQNSADIPVGVTGSLIPPAVGLANGAIRLTTSITTAHNEAAMEPGGLLAAKGAFAVPSSAALTAPIAGQLPKVFFEARVRFAQITTMAMFIGLARPGKAASGGMFSHTTDAAVVTDAIGFWVNPVTDGLTPHQWATSATQIQPGYSANGAAATIANQSGFTGGVGGIPSSVDYIGTAGATFYSGQPVVSALTDFTKLGFCIDPLDPAGQVLRFYQDGVLLASQTLTQIVAANWPSDIQLNPLVYIQSTGAGTVAQLMTLDWLIAAQQISTE